MAAFHSGDRLGAVVADVGSFATKIGWAGDDSPRSYFRSNVAVLKEDQPGTSSSSATSNNRKRRAAIQKVNYDYYTSAVDSKNYSDGSWQVSNPVNSTTGLWYDPDPQQHGADWYDLLQKFLPHGYETALAKSSVEDHPLLLVERSYNPPPIRQQVMECLFEDLQVPAAFLAKDAVLSCYGCGRTTGTVVDVGYSGTTVTPVYDGYAELAGIRRSPAGVQAMDELILQQLDELFRKEQKQKQQRNSGNTAPQLVPDQEVMPLYQVRPIRPGHDPPSLVSLPRPRRAAEIHAGARLQIAQECRELGAGAAINLTASSATDGTATAVVATSTFHAPHKPFVLPDGTTVVDIPSANRFAAADMLYGTDPASVQRRENLLQEKKKELEELISQVTAAMSEDDDTNDGDENTKTQKDKFSEEAAVGISKRRTKRGAGVAGSSASKQQQAATKDQQQRPMFSNHHLLKACAPHLQTLLDQQLTALPAASMVCDAAYRCDRDQQAALLGNVVLGGGGSCLGPTDQAVPDLIREQVEAIIHAHTPGWRVKVLTPAIPERAILSWLGGSILGSLGTFHEMWITKAEYEEWGTAIVNRKCP